MKRVLFVVYDNDSYIHTFPSGVAYLTAVLRVAGHEVVIYNQDVYHYSDEHLVKFLDTQDEFDVVGVGVVGGYFQYQKLLKISAAINNSRKRPKVFVLGGHGPSPEPEYFLRKTKADVVVIGEGEDTIVELMSDARWVDISGIAYRQGESVFINARRPLIKDINIIPWPAYDAFPIDYYKLIRAPNCCNNDFVMSVLSGRGCRWQCSFCYRMDKGFRPRKTENIIAEIEFLKETYGITYISFSDELLMSSEERVLEFCQSLLAAKIDIKWECNGRLNLASKKVLGSMKKAGCVFVNYGVESVDDGVLRKMRKGLVVRQIVEGVENTLSVGISPGLNMIFGCLGDTEETLAKAVQFLLKYDDHAQMRTIRPVTPYPGSPLYYYAIEHELLEGVEDFYSKHINSDLLTVNFTSLSDERFHEILFAANMTLLEKYFKMKQQHYVDIMRDLYQNKNMLFRGFRTT